MLNLRTFDDDASRHGGPLITTKILSEPEFAQNKILGNIGAPLDSQQWEAGLVESDDEMQNSDDGMRRVRDTEMMADPVTTFVPVVSAPGISIAIVKTNRLTACARRYMTILLKIRSIWCRLAKGSPRLLGYSIGRA